MKEAKSPIVLPIFDAMEGESSDVSSSNSSENRQETETYGAEDGGTITTGFAPAIGDLKLFSKGWTKTRQQSGSRK